ncbi:hypothetical protein B0A50_07690 [Salinomyces thailandicus]|uniref:AB hydrolase-1 domain-containing protein n=1 Tax=Salinomyces thailandicus TaxID=706561 RepID=A0A4U0TLV3_9PEZI|nr:hypothetical protein B0A50_07690 [Salinomyces thailandica]
MDHFEHKTLVTKPNQLTYSYYLSPSFHDQNIQTLILVHGYPDSAQMWAGAIPYLQKLPFRMLVLDILGLGDSSKPTDPSLYNYRKQADSLDQILRCEKVGGKVIPVGHDWGSAICQRFYLYYPERCSGLCLVSLAYQPPTTEPFILDEANQATTHRFGYPQWEYFNFFTASDAPDLMRNNMDRFYECMHGLYPSAKAGEEGKDIWMREMFCVPDGMREYITSTGKYTDYTVPLKSYAEDTQVKKQQIDRLFQDGMEGAVCYYTSLTTNTMLEDERELCQSGKRSLDVPVLYIGQTGDWVCRTDLMSDARKQGLVPDVEEKVIEAGHWVLYERPLEVAELLGDWLQKRFAVST